MYVYIYTYMYVDIYIILKNYGLGLLLCRVGIIISSLPTSEKQTFESAMYQKVFSLPPLPTSYRLKAWVTGRWWRRLSDSNNSRYCSAPVLPPCDLSHFHAVYFLVIKSLWSHGRLVISSGGSGNDKKRREKSWTAQTQSFLDDMIQ